jgi:hypothetical protein
MPRPRQRGSRQHRGFHEHGDDLLVAGPGFAERGEGDRGIDGPGRRGCRSSFVERTRDLFERAVAGEAELDSRSAPLWGA